jgi:hypothetical protein
MNDCESMTDKMALVVHGRAEWTESEAAHLRGCAACTAEWQVVQAASRLGAASTRELDPARVSRIVLERLAAARKRRMTGWMVLAAAAAIMLLVWARGPGVGRDTPTASTGGFRLPLAELESLDARQLRAVLQDLEGPLGGSAAPESPGLGDLENQELERVLRSLEG